MLLLNECFIGGGGGGGYLVTTESGNFWIHPPLYSCLIVSFHHPYLSIVIVF
jgi:hypothetical protein